MNTFLKRAVTVAILAGVSAGANAAPTNDILGMVSPGVPTSFTGSVVPAGDFNDVFSFSLPANQGSGYSVINFPLDVPGHGTFNTILSTMSLISDPDGVRNSGDEHLLASAVLGGSNTSDALTLHWGPNAGGNFDLNITGMTNGSLGGLYSGSIEVSAIPEPETYAMLLAGLGLMGAVVRRRSQRKNS
jgi:hypothetical protein